MLGVKKSPAPTLHPQFDRLLLDDNGKVWILDRIKMAKKQ
jgi:hypothetical protein